MRSKLTFVILALCLLSAPVYLFGQEPAKQVSKIEPPRLLAVLFYADWCASCKVLEPKLNQVKRDFQGKPVLFTRFNFTDKFTDDQSGRYAALIGLDKYYRENDGKTGFMLLIDAHSNRLLGKITKDKSADEIKTMLTHALMGHEISD